MTTAPSILTWIGLSFLQDSALSLGTIYIAAWAFAFGAVIGSFLNVVIWRMPLGKSVVAPRSRCPKCRSAIRGYDNIPILSWLLLRGRCRDCKTSISYRYPIVEFCVGVLVMLLAMCEGVTGGVNLPIDLVGSVAVESAWWSWAAVGLHTALLLTLFCQTMILFDGKTVPRRLYTLSVLAAVVLPILFSGIRPAAIAMNGYESASVSGTYLGQLVSMIAGASAGIVIGWLCLPATANEQQDRLSTVWAFAICGTALGWQAAVAVGFISSVGYFTAKFALYLTGIRQRSPRSAMTFLVCAGYILCWGDISAALPQLGVQMTATSLCNVTLVVAFISMATSWVPKPKSELPSPESIQPIRSSPQPTRENETVAV